MTRSAAASALLRWQQQGIIQNVRRDMYAIIDLTSGGRLADKYEISSRITSTSYVGWHTLHNISSSANSRRPHMTQKRGATISKKA